MKFTSEEMQAAYKELLEKERPIYVFLGALAGVLPAAAIYLLFASMGGIFIFFLLAPPAVIGLFARYIGFPFRLKPRLPVGAISVVMHVLGCYALQLNPFAYLLTPVCAIVAIAISRVKLSQLQELAVGHIELGTIKPT